MDRLTNREQEILEIIKKNPMISQDQLASKLGITRSAAAVHISNLIKKKSIKGRGYVVSHDDGMIIIGRVFCSITKEANKSLEIVPDGWGYFLATKLGAKIRNVSLISAVGADYCGEIICHKLIQNNVDISYVSVSKDMSTATQLKYMGDEEISNKIEYHHHGAQKKLDEEAIMALEHVLRNGRMFIVDGSMENGLIRQILKISRKYSILVKIVEPIQIDEYWTKLLDARLHQIIISKNKMSTVGQSWESIYNSNQSLWNLCSWIVLCSSEGTMIVEKGVKTVINLLPNQGVDRSFVAGFIYGMYNDYSARQSARIGLGNHPILKDFSAGN
ncbi:pseudouridine kinase [Desulfitispora alkaliphila]|uniref:PfkB family carbohydrate kinase n=1 Tax=Desulfitispora alkaliphila TaxID=622674 RepID=UPI003D23FDEB